MIASIVRRVGRTLGLATTALLLSLGAWEHTGAQTVTDGRYALVVGNARYRTLPLSNPENDARLIASRLRALGFNVYEHKNLGVREFRRVLREFVRLVQQADGVVVFYYAGHGVQIDGRNFLLPVDIDVAKEEEVKDDSIDIDDLFMSQLEKVRAQTRIVILDACRDNPFAGRSRAIRTTGGLAEMNARGTLIAYASAPGATAEDGPPGTNSVYTRHLAEEMTVDGLEVEQMFKRVRVKVLNDTRQRQVPWVNTSLTTNFSFKGRPAIDGGDAQRHEQIARLEEELKHTRGLLERARLRMQETETATAAPATAGALARPSALPLPATVPGPSSPVPQAETPVAASSLPVPAAVPASPTTTPASPTATPTPPTATAASPAASPAPPAGPVAQTLPAGEPQREFARLLEQLNRTEQALQAARRDAKETATQDVEPARPTSVTRVGSVNEARPLTRTRADRCADLLNRAALGEDLGTDARTTLETECKK